MTSEKLTQLWRLLSEWLSEPDWPERGPGSAWEAVAEARHVLEAELGYDAVERLHEETG